MPFTDIFISMEREQIEKMKHAIEMRKDTAVDKVNMSLIKSILRSPYGSGLSNKSQE